MLPNDPGGMAAMYLSLTDDEPLERRRPTLAALACCLFVALATPIGWALAADDALATPPAKAKAASGGGDDDEGRGDGRRGGDGDESDADDSRQTVSGTDNSVSAPNTDSHSVTRDASKSAPGNSASNAGTSHSVTRPSVSSSDNSRSGANTSHSVTRDQSASRPGNSASNAGTSHSVTRR